MRLVEVAALFARAPNLGALHAFVKHLPLGLEAVFFSRVSVAKAEPNAFL